MKLPQSMVANISWWEHTVKECKWGMQMDDVFTLHFKQWWRRKIVIKIRQIVTDIKGDVYTYSRSLGACKLLGQLHAIK